MAVRLKTSLHKFLSLLRKGRSVSTQEVVSWVGYAMIGWNCYGASQSSNRRSVLVDHGGDHA